MHNLWMNLLKLLKPANRDNDPSLASTMLDLVGWTRNPERYIDSGETFLQICATLSISLLYTALFFLLFPRLYKEYDTGKLGDGIFWKLCGCF